MRIGILGQGVSGIFLALFLKNNNKDLDVTIIDKNSIPARKLLNTGNGRCNLANSDINEKSYNSPFVKNEIPNDSPSGILCAKIASKNIKLDTNKLLFLKISVE